MNQSIKRIYIRLPNWIGDVCMSLPSLNAVLSTGCEVVICAKPWAKDLLSGIQAHDFIALSGRWASDYKLIKQHRSTEKSVGLLLPDSLSSALTFRLAGLSCAGYQDDGRSLLLKWAIKKPNLSVHAVESWYYLTHTALKQWGFNSPLNPELRLNLPLTHQHLQASEQVLAMMEHKPFILIAPTATGKHKGREKVWPFFEELTLRLKEEGYLVVMSPPPNEKEMALKNAPSATLLPPVSLGAFVGLLKKASIVVCNDSGVSHLASLGAPQQITLIGVTEPSRTGPWSPTALVLGKMDAWPSVDEVFAQIKQMI